MWEACSAAGGNDRIGSVIRMQVIILRIEDGQRAEATRDRVHIMRQALPLAPGQIVEDVLAIQCLVNELQNAIGKVRVGRKVVVRDLQVLDIAPRPRQPGTQNAAITGIRTSMYTQVLLENGIPFIHHPPAPRPSPTCPRGWPCRRSSTQTRPTWRDRCCARNVLQAAQRLAGPHRQAKEGDIAKRC